LNAGVVLGDTSSGAITTTLPTAAGNLGLTYTLKLVDATNNWTISRTGTDTIDGESSKILSVDNETITLRSDGVSKWYILYSSIDFAEIGMPKMYMGTTAPSGYLMCDGSAKSRTKYARLFAIMGEACGEGDGSTTFDLPDCRGKFFRGVDHGEGNDPDAASRTAMATGGNTGDNVGTVQGHEIDAHKHDYKANAYNNAEGGSAGYYNVREDAGLTQNTKSSGGNETRPINVYTEYIIKY